MKFRSYLQVMQISPLYMAAWSILEHKYIQKVSLGNSINFFHVCCSNNKIQITVMGKHFIYSMVESIGFFDEMRRNHRYKKIRNMFIPNVSIVLFQVHMSVISKFGASDMHLSHTNFK